MHYVEQLKIRGMRWPPHVYTCDFKHLLLCRVHGSFVCSSLYVRSASPLSFVRFDACWLSLVQVLSDDRIDMIPRYQRYTAIPIQTNVVVQPETNPAALEFVT